MTQKVPTIPQWHTIASPFFWLWRANCNTHQFTQPVVASMKDEYGYCGGDVGMGTIGEDEDLEKPVNIEDTR